MDFSVEREKITEELVKLRIENEALRTVIQKKIFLSKKNSSEPPKHNQFNPPLLTSYFTLENEFEDLLSALPDVVLIHINGIIVYSNIAATTLTGFTHEEFIGRHVIGFIAEDQKAKAIENMKKRERGEIVNGYELKIITKNGETKDVLVRTSGRIKKESEAVVIILIDITEGKKAEKKLKESEEKFKTLAESGPYAVLMYQDDKWIYANPAAEKISGYTKDELLNMYFWEFVADEKITEVKEIGRLRQKGEYAPQAYELLVKTKQNESKWVYVIGSTIVINNKNAGLIALIDITELKEIEAKLRATEKKLKNVVENNPIIAFEIDQNGYFQLFEGYGIRDSIFQTEKIVGTSFWDVFKEYPEICEKFRLSLNGEMQKFINQFDDRYLETVINPVKAGDGEVISCIGISIDITERKIIEQKIINQNEELIKLNSEKDKFFSIISHDLRSPLHGLLGITKILCEEYDSLGEEEFIELSKNMYSSALNLNKLLENLLVWAKNQRGLLTYTPKILELYEIIQSNILSIKQKALEKDITISVVGNENIRIIADEHMIDSIIRNLLSNALKFTRRGGIIKITYCIIAKNYVRIAIQDNGIGIKQDNLPKLFKIYEKIKSKGTEDEPSSGLGLILCKDFVEKQKGEIWVESQEGKGTVFYFTLPLFK
ncbi:MAG: PAS domain-containing sensor histidine kinase [bacterium]